MSMKQTSNTTKPIYDQEVAKWFRELSFEQAQQVINDSGSGDRYKVQYRDWILSSENNRIEGLHNFPHVFVTNAVTHSLEAFFMAYAHKRRIRTYRGEYTHIPKLIAKFELPDVRLDAAPIDENDVVLMSCPFSAHGEKHFMMESVLDECDRLGVPVFVDMAYFGLCQGVNLDLNHTCIKHVAFSLSKAFSLEGVRIGIEFSRHPNHPLDVSHFRNYHSRLGTYVAMSLFSRFSPDFIFNKYRDKQVEICRGLKLTPSESVLFGTSHDRVWQAASKEIINRPCITPALQEWENLQNG